LIDNYGLFPDIDLDRLWPVVLVLIGGALIAAGQTKQPWEKKDWSSQDKKEETSTDASAADNASAAEPGS
jgi:phage shock protein C